MQQQLFAANFIVLALTLLGVHTSLADEAVVSDEQQLQQIIHAVGSGWENADGTPFYEHFLGQAGARFIESGGQNNGLKDLVEHHVEPEGDALGDVDLGFANIETHIEGDFAWAIVDVEFIAKVKKDGRVIDHAGYETFLFRRTDDGWKVVHTHSSTRAKR